MNFDKWGEVINGEDTFEQIAKDLIETGKCIIGWTDEGADHRDILFTYKPKKYGTLQRGFRWCYLYISIMDFTSYGFLIENDKSNQKHNGYVKEKLRLHDNDCDDKICELINGVIKYIDVMEGNYV